MDPSIYFTALIIALAIVVFTFAIFQFIWKQKEATAVSEFSRRK
jgi:hypothetical protein